jgi:hypothetical protein
MYPVCWTEHRRKVLKKLLDLILSFVVCFSGVLDGDRHKVSSGSADAPGISFFPPKVFVQGAPCRPRMQLV